MSWRFIKWGFLGAALVALISGATGGMVVFLLGNMANEVPVADSASSTTPGMDYIAEFTCPDGLIREVIVRGVEDQFSPDGDEPATPRPEVLQLQAVQQMASGEIPNAYTMRDYDEGGSDKHLIDHFPVEPGIVSGKLVISAQPFRGGENDSGALGNLSFSNRFFTERLYYFAAWTKPMGIDGLKIFDLTKFSKARFDDQPSDIITYLNSTERPLEVDLHVTEDTAVDFVALLLCRQPSTAMGTGFTSASAPHPENGLTYLACGWNLSSPLCQPRSGHLRCDAIHRIACYKEGTKKPPNIKNDRNSNLDQYVPGDVKLTEPVRPDRFKTIADVNRYCTAEFGKGWRTLSYHEGGGAAVFTHSPIEPYATGLVHVADQPYGNCWGRPESVIDR